MSFYNSAALTALRLITAKGRAIEVARLAKTLDAVNGTTSAVTATKGEVKALVLPLSTQDAKLLDNRLLESYVAGKLRKLLIAARGAPFEPVAKDVFSFDDLYWSAHGCTPLNPAGTALVYTVVVEQTALSTADIAAFA